MKRLVAVVLALLALGGLYMGWRSGLFAGAVFTGDAAGERDPRRGDAVDAAATVEVDLFFPGVDGMLHPEPREIAGSDDGEELATALLAALMSGPRGQRLRPPLPSGIAVRRVYIVDKGTVGEGTAILDLTQGGEGTYAVGASEELLALYSLVNTLLLNVEQASRVIVLWNGEQPTTFAGHVDTTRPLVPDLDLIAGGGAGSASGDGHE